ncbi:MAG TPA: sialidase family protein, partial [Reyranellaceae bacterium]|nr:sialidase family protein [Reyranellaceae bacterium]
FARSGDGGRSFSAPVNLSNSVPGDGKGRINPHYWHNGSYDLQAAAGGKVYVAWTEFDGPLWFARSADGGRTFGQPQLVAGGKGDRPARAPALAVHPDGSVLLAWTHGDDDGADIHVARWAQGSGAFSPPVTIGHRSRYDDAPVLAVDAKGVVHLAWGESEGKPLQRQRIAYARSRDGGRSFEAPRAVLTAAAPFVSAAYPALRVDGEGRVLVLAEVLENLRQLPRALALTVSGDGGNTFAPAGVVPHSSDPRGGFNGSSQGLLMRKLLVSEDGRVFVVNSALAEGSHSRIWLVQTGHHRAGGHPKR